MVETLKRSASLLVSVFLVWQSIALLSALHDVRPGGWAATLFRARRTREAYFDGSTSGLDHLDTQSRKSEFGHVGTFVVLTAVGLAFVVQGATLLGAATLAFNVLGNLYPALLQRHHRMRIQRIEARAGGEG